MGNVSAVPLPLRELTFIERQISRRSTPESPGELRKQIILVVSEGDEVTQAHIARMSFLRCVINESWFLLRSPSRGLPHHLSISLRIVSIPKYPSISV
jgi:hypothetical protein